MLLAISGSPRKQSNTTAILQKILTECSKEGFNTKLIELAKSPIQPCTDCGMCRTKLDCSIKDNFLSLIPDLQKAKIILVCSPVYFGTVSAQLKAFMDRTVMLRRNGFTLADKFGCGIAIAGSRNGGQEHTIQTIHNWMFIHDMNVFADGKPTSHFGGILNAHEFGGAEKDEVGMQTISSLIEKIKRIL